MGDGGGGTFSVVSADISSTATQFGSMSQDADSEAKALLQALAAAENGVGDPTASGGVGDLITAWMSALGLLGPLVEKTSSALLGSADTYSTVDSHIAGAEN